MSTLQERLGFTATDRLLIVHADDIGMCEATVSAWRDLPGQSAMTSASAMATCPWFPAAGKAVQEAGDAADMGLHLVFNCEWRDHYRWGPITGSDTPAGLCAEDGYFYPLAADTYQNANLALASAELAAQFKRAQTLGLPLTHLDCHMMTALHPQLVTHMLALGQQNALPILVPRYADAHRLAHESKMPLAWCEQTSAQLQQAEVAGQLNPVDDWALLPFGQSLSPAERLDWVKQALRNDFSAPGVYGLIGHPANDGTELRAIAPDWQTRVADRDLFASPALRDLIDSEGFKLIGMKAIAQLHTQAAV